MAIVMAGLGTACSNEAATGDAASSESFATGAGTVVGGEDGIRSMPSQMSWDSIALSDGSAATPIDRHVEGGAYVYQAVEFVSASGGDPIRVTSPVPFSWIKPGPDGSALVIGTGYPRRTLHRLHPSSAPELVADADVGGVTTATDGSIVWTETGTAPKLHRIRNGQDKAVAIPKDPHERTFAQCRTFLEADAENVYAVCISGFTLARADEVQRVWTFAADGSLAADVSFPKEHFGGIITGFDGGGRLVVLDTGYTGDGDKNVGVHGYLYDPKTKTAAVLSIPVFPHTDRWRAYSILPTPDGGFALPGIANERFGMVKLLADGALDRTFDDDGAMSASGPDDWHALLSGRVSSDGARVDFIGFGADGRETRAYRLAVQLR